MVGGDGSIGLFSAGAGARLKGYCPPKWVYSLYLHT